MRESKTLRDLESLFAQALELEGAAREEVVRSAPTELQRQLRLMLEGRNAGFLDRPATASLHQTYVGQHVGRWLLIEKTGEGGTGVVYRAQSDQDGVHVEAALKILRPGFDTGFLRSRFHQERQILAGLDHPGIARFIDCGADDERRSYLVMEFVHGQSLHDFLARTPGLAARVELFEGVVRAVEYLHSRLVAHGDVKPGNIRVSADGLPKLLDFGAARLLDAGTPAGELTRMMVTPEYASPERLRGGGPAVPDDIYSLGRLLSAILPPSAPADLRLIAERCQAEEPEGRYASAAAVVEDLRRWREGFPVRARTATAWYRLTRFVQRQWAAVGLTALLVAALAFAWIVAARGERRAELLAREAKVQADLAAQQAREAQRQQARADLAASLANQNADRYRALTYGLLALNDFSASQVVTAYTALQPAMEQVVEEYERSSPSRTLFERSVAWRRLAGNLAFQGRFTKAFPAWEKGAQLARKAFEEEPTRQRHLNYTLALLDGARFHMVRGMLRGNTEDVARASKAAADEVRRLDPRDRQVAELNEASLIGLALRAEEQEDEKETLRLWELAEARSLGLLRQVSLRAMVRMDLKQGRLDRVAATCAEVQRRGLNGRTVSALCPALRANGNVLSVTQLLRQQTLADSYERVLAHQPASYEAHMFLAEIRLSLADHALATGFPAKARGEFDSAQAHIRYVEAVDPGGPGAKRLSEAASVTQSRLPHD